MSLLITPDTLRKRNSAAIQQMLTLAHEAADAAGIVSRAYFRSDVDVDLKADESPVTAADRNAETAIRTLLAEQVPEHGIVGEEHGLSNPDHPIQWIIDPIDGTKSFISGNPIFGGLVAVTVDGVPIIGVIDMPVLGERWSGAETEDGSMLLYNGLPLKPKQHVSALKDCQIHTTSPEMFSRPEEQDANARLTAACRNRRWGGDCMNYALIANGQVDLVVEAGMQNYDYMAPVAVVQAAGGVITDWSGAPLTLKSHGSGQVLAARTPALHAEALSLLKR